MREAVQRGVAIDFARRKPCGRKVGPVGRIGPGVRFEADGVGLPIEPAALSGGGAVEKVSGIDLQPGLVGEQFEHAAGRWLSQPRGEARLAARRAEAEIVIVAAAHPQLRMVVADPRADLDACAEVERRAGHRAGRLRQRDRAGIDGEEMIRRHGEVMIENIPARARAGQIEKAVIGEIDHGGTIGPRRHVEPEFHRSGKTPGHLHFQRAGIAFLAIGAGVGKRHGRMICHPRSRQSASCGDRNLPARHATHWRRYSPRVAPRRRRA